MNTIEKTITNALEAVKMTNFYIKNISSYRLVDFVELEEGGCLICIQSEHNYYVTSFECSGWEMFLGAALEYDKFKTLEHDNVLTVYIPNECNI